MLTKEIMGLFALGVLWLNGALVLAVAWKQLRAIGALRKMFAASKARGELVEGEVAEADAGVFARRHVAQTGRAVTTRGPSRILFTDGPQSFEVHGGALDTGDGRVTVDAAPIAASEVWTDDARSREAAGCSSDGEFDAAWTDASRFKGHTREVEVEVRRGDRVWVHGKRRDDALGPWDDRPLLVSMVDPIAWCAGRARLLVLFLVGGALSLALVTAIALVPPPFGSLSTVGGGLCLAWFLAIQPLGTAVRDAVRTPARQPVGVEWQRSRAVPSRAT